MVRLRIEYFKNFAQLAKVVPLIYWIIWWALHFEPPWNKYVKFIEETIPFLMVSFSYTTNLYANYDAQAVKAWHLPLYIRSFIVCRMNTIYSLFYYTDIILYLECKFSSKYAKHSIISNIPLPFCSSCSDDIF